MFCRFVHAAVCEISCFRQEFRGQVLEVRRCLKQAAGRQQPAKTVLGQKGICFQVWPYAKKNRSLSPSMSARDSDLKRWNLNSKFPCRSEDKCVLCPSALEDVASASKHDQDFNFVSLSKSSCCTGFGFGVP